VAALKSQAEQLESALKAIRERVEELETAAKAE
jgi:hypothetical protein